MKHSVNIVKHSVNIVKTYVNTHVNIIWAPMELKAAILDLGNKFWPLLPQFIRLMTPLRLAILTLQGDHAKLSDVMGAWIRIHASQMDLLADETCTFQAQTRSQIKSIFVARFKFLYHPAHLVAFALDPRYSQVCTAPSFILRHWLRVLHHVL